MEIGLGGMGLPPRDFWSMSLVEWLSALEGYIERHTGKRASEHDDDRVTRGEYERLKEQHRHGAR